MSKLATSEVFGPTFQGEGPSMGRLCAFVRLMGCNLACSWCDTPYTWDAKRYDLAAETTMLESDAIAKQVIDTGAGLCIISGGEPLLHQKRVGWQELMVKLINAGVEVHVETNGTQTPTNFSEAYISRFVVSPKLAHSGDVESDRIIAPALEHFAALAHKDRAVFKFVAQTPEDLDEIEAHLANFGIPRKSVWVMPEGVTAEAQVEGLERLAPHIVAKGWNVSSRLHVLTWGHKRGV